MPWRSERERVDLNNSDGSQQVYLDARGLQVCGVQLDVNAGSDATNVTIKIEGRLEYRDDRTDAGGDGRPGVDWYELDSNVAITGGAGITDRNLDISRYAQVRAYVADAQGSASEGTLIIYGEGTGSNAQLEEATNV